MTRIEPAAALVGDIAVPAVKGICQRGALLAAIADGVSELRSFGHAADTDAALDAIRALGVEVGEPDETTVRITGRGLRGLVAPGEPIDCRNAGKLKAPLWMQNRSKGGSAETAQTALLVRPRGEPSSAMVVTTVTPVGKEPRTDRNS